MSTVDKILQEMRNNPKGIRFDELKKVCEHYFGRSRINGSHYIFHTGELENPRINIQNSRGKSKEYQVKQVVVAIKAKKERSDV